MSDAKVALGRRLFHDARLSSTGRYACASCHRQELAFTDGRARAIGTTGEVVRRATMSLTNVAYNITFTWGDPRLRSLEAQMRRPLFNVHPVEMGLDGGGTAAVKALAGDSSYATQFAAAFPADPAFPGDPAPLSMDHIIKAIAAFERTLISGRSPFDRYVFSDEATALTDSARRGMTLFYSRRAGCGRCHSGLNFSGPIDYVGRPPISPSVLNAAQFSSNGLYDLDGHGGYPRTDQGLFEITRRAADMGRFRVPTLRNVALTAPYMHDGSLATLDAVLDHYQRGIRSVRGISGVREASGVRALPLRPFTLTPDERTDLLAFLGSLTDAEFVDDSRFRAPPTR